MGRVIQCYFCGNKTFMDEVGTHQHEDVVWDFDTKGREYPAYSSKTTWKMFFCPVCNNVTLLKFYSDTIIKGPDGEPFDIQTILYPEINHFAENIPKSIRDAFEAVLKVKNIDKAICLIAIRRTLEAVCKEQGAEGSNLLLKIKNLSERSILPPILGSMSHVLRILGNDAAHEKIKQIYASDVTQMIEFIKLIIEYIYVLPYKLAHYKTEKTSEDL